MRTIKYDLKNNKIIFQIKKVNYSTKENYSLFTITVNKNNLSKLSFFY